MDAPWTGAPSSSLCNGVSWVGAPTLATGTITVNRGRDLRHAVERPDGNRLLHLYRESGLDAGQRRSHQRCGRSDRDDAAPSTADDRHHYVRRGRSPSTPPSPTPVAVTGTTGEPGVLAWSLVGPVGRGADGTCNGVSWSGGQTVSSGVATITNDGLVTTGPTAVDSVGCYSWSDNLAGTDFLGQTAGPAGTPSEVTLVQPFQPVLTTAATMANGKFFDTITVSGSGVAVAPGAPASAALAWSLLGPVAASGGNCASVTWAGQPVRASGTLTITRDGTYRTPSTTLSGPGSTPLRTAERHGGR